MSIRFNEQLIAYLLGDAKASPELERWLKTEQGQRELKAYGKALETLKHSYGNVSSSKSVSPVYYTEMSTPVGRLFVAATDKGLVRISFLLGERDFASELRARLKREVLRSQDRVAAIGAQLKEYFAGRRSSFEVSIDWSLTTPFKRRVLEAASEVPAGRVTSYGALARRIGRPHASRAVGNALGRNPVPIVIPCHRIVREGGDLGGYTGGLNIKRKLLQIEGAL